MPDELAAEICTGGWPAPRFPFSDAATAAWLRRYGKASTPRRRSARWGAWLRRRHYARLAQQRAERGEAMTRLARTGGDQWGGRR